MTTQEACAQAFENGRRKGDAEGYARGKAEAVKHGHWIRRGNEMKCSNPKCQFIYYSNHDDFNYCPNCGARMDGDGDA